MTVSRKTCFAAGAVVALVLGSGSAYAATGGDFHLGQRNVAKSASVLVNPNGTALVLKADDDSPPLRVNSNERVAKLNADQLDGRHERSFALARGGFGMIMATGVGFDGNSNGVSESIAAVATCPAGSQRTGGGFTDQTTGSELFINVPTGPKSWSVQAETDDVGPAADADIKAYVICYNPRGEVASATVRTSSWADALAQLPPALRQTVLAKVAAN